MLGKKRNAQAFSKKNKPQAEQKKTVETHLSIAPLTKPAALNSISEQEPTVRHPVDFAGANRAHTLFFTPEAEGKNFSSVLADVQDRKSVV